MASSKFKSGNLRAIAGMLFLLPAILAGAAWAAEKPAVVLIPSEEEVSSLLAPVFKKRSFVVSRIALSPISGLWEVILETDAGKTILYIDSSRKYFLGGPIITLDGMRNITEESLLSMGMPKADPSQVPVEDAIPVGNAGAGKRIVVFLSPVCSPCNEMLQTIKQVAVQRKDIGFYIKMLPESAADESYWRSETIVSGRSLELLEKSLAGSTIPKPDKSVPQVARTVDIADKLGIHATPTIMLMDGTLVEGTLSREALLGWIDRHSEVGRSMAQGGRAKRDRSE
ncbi:MAG: hypothetical protein CVU57_13110 [Deltaproteobacteria bacterium HGW-Deltaproteobacteria-15]|jgi:thiol:disulfide interchange protein DsbC|nr:MAG: hypothetical protein CVU57_13110 [Deltaproteobacteria bacterium HGW-Deltaproteobacteria-15]